MRVISGIYRGKKLLSADAEITRPTSDRAKEGLFNILNHYLKTIEKSWEDIVFCDVFSGSGSIGIEAVSRGTKKVFLFENNRLALNIIKTNTKNIPINIIFGDAINPPVASYEADIVFFDAPYGKGLWQKALNSFVSKGWITQNTLIIVEIDKTITEEVPTTFNVDRTQDYGRNRFLFLSLKR